MASIFTAVYYQMELLWLTPAALLVVYLAVVDFKKLFFLLFASIPFSMEYTFPNGFSTDLPSEPLMIGLMGVTFIYVLLNFRTINTKIIRHPLTLMLFLHLGWTFITTVTSENFLFSLKFSLAKIWYVTVFYFLASKILRTEEDIKTLFKVVFFPLVIAVSIIEIRHASKGLTFETINSCLSPFFRNHVSYAALTALFLPFAWYAMGWQRKYSIAWWIYGLGMFIILLGVQFSYTRAAYAAILIAIGMYVVIRLRMMRWAIVGIVVFFTFLGSFLLEKNNFLGFAPDYKKTIMHQDFSNLLQATYKFQDISTMERVYRWVAAGHMIDAKPYMGFGPGNFYNFYRHYVLTSFKTYVSDNPEKSGIHCYFLMVWVEQGFIGLLLFLCFNFGVLLLGEKVYHSTEDPSKRRIALLAVLSFVVIDALLLINDMVETDKVGAFFFVCAAILVNLDLQQLKTNSEK